MFDVKSKLSICFYCLQVDPHLALIFHYYVHIIFLITSINKHFHSLQELRFSSCLFKAQLTKIPVCSDWSAFTGLCRHIPRCFSINSATQPCDIGTLQRFDQPSDLYRAKTKRWIKIGNNLNDMKWLKWQAAGESNFTGNKYKRDVYKQHHYANTGHWGWWETDVTHNAKKVHLECHHQPGHLRVSPGSMKSSRHQSINLVTKILWFAMLMLILPLVENKNGPLLWALLSFPSLAEKHSHTTKI